MKNFVVTTPNLFLSSSFPSSVYRKKAFPAKNQTVYSFGRLRLCFALQIQ